MQSQRTILQVIDEMCIYWGVCRAHRVKTILHFQKLANIREQTLSAINPEHLALLYRHLRQTSSGTDESVKRKFEYVKRVFKYAHGRGYLKHNPCTLLKLPKSRRAPIVHLMQHDVNKLEKLRLTGILRKVRDWFLFQCYTGLAYSDFVYFNRTSVHMVQQRFYISGTRVKTGKEYIVPFTEKARAIAEKYHYNFDRIWIDDYNIYLKTLQSLAGIQVNLTTHVARRTFGQLMIDKGIPMEVVSKMLGHSSTAMTERYYARVGMLRVIHDVSHLAAA